MLLLIGCFYLFFCEVPAQYTFLLFSCIGLWSSLGTLWIVFIAIYSPVYGLTSHPILVSFWMEVLNFNVVEFIGLFPQG